MQASDAQRLALLDALAAAMARRAEVLAVLDVAASEDEAATRIADLLGTNRSAAEAVLDLQLRRFTPDNRERIDAERRSLLDPG